MTAITIVAYSLSAHLCVALGYQYPDSHILIY